MARGQSRYHKPSHGNTNNNRFNSRRDPEDVNDDYTQHHEEDSRSDVYGSGYNYNPRTSALSVQSSYTSMAFYLPSNTHMVDPYGDEFNEGWNSGGEGSRISKDAYTEGFNGYPDPRNATQASNSSLAKHYTYSQPQNPPPGSSSRYDPHFREFPLPESIPSSPSPEYKAISSQPSTHLDDPSEARKLLVLDLNGTLVHRAPPPKRDVHSGRGQRRNGKRDRDRRGRDRDRTAHHDVDLKDEFGRDILPPPQSVPTVFEKDEFGRDVPRRTPASFTMDVAAERDEFGREIRPSGMDSEYPSDRDNDNTNNGNWDFYKDPVYLAQRPLRTVHLRPYIPAFVAYLFHPKTITWLDVMVWSSAQPHSVEDMVRRVFKEHLGNYKPIAEKKGQDGDGDRNVAGTGNDLLSGQTRAAENEEQHGLEKEKADIPGLIAVWARDTLGLDQAAYNTKTQTTKDLTKPWEKLTPLIPGNEFLHDTEVSVSSSPENTGLPITTIPISTASATSLPADAPEVTAESSTPTPNSTSTTNAPKKTPYVHSPQTTLLLDDSPLKARLQPYNHVCVPEYSREIYLRDCKVVPTPSHSKDKETSDDPAPAAASDTTSPTPDIQPSNDEVATASVEGDVTIPAVAVSVTLTDEDQTQIDEDADTEQQLDPNTSIDSILVPTVPNSPSKKRKRTLNDTGSNSDVFFKAESGMDVEVVPGQGLVGPGEGLGLGLGLAAGDIGLILQKTKSSLSDMSISADSSTSLRTIATEIVDPDPIGSAQNYDGMPPPALPVHHSRSLSSMGSGSVGNLNVADESNANKRIPRKYDETMLAVIGILDAIRSESNVAAWMKDKGIFTLVEGDEDDDEDDESVVTQQAMAETGTGTDEGQGLGDSEEDDEELEKLYECNIVKSLKDAATTQPAPPSIFAQPVGFKPKKERWRKKRKVDLGSNSEGGDKVVSDAVTSTTVPSNAVAMTLPSAHQALVSAAPTPATSVLVDAADGSRSNIDETVNAVNQSGQTFSNPSSPPSSAPSEAQPQLELRDPETNGGLSSSSSSPPATGRDVAIDKVVVGDVVDDDEIPGLGQFVFQPNLSPPEGTEVIDVDAMDIDAISKLAELDPNRWFQYRHVRKYWIRRGRKALEELGIDVEAHRA